VDVITYSENYLSAVMDFARRATGHFSYNWVGREDLFRWKYLEQTCSLPDGEAPVWLAVEDGIVRGLLGAVVSDFQWRGRTIPGLAAMDLYLEEACRGSGTAREMLALYEAATDLKLMLVSTAQVHKLYLRRGYTSLPGIGAQTVYRGPAGAARRLLRRFAGPQSGAVIAEGVDRLRSWLLSQPGVSLLPDTVPDEFDELIQAAQSRFELASRRDGNWLLWKYRHHPDRQGEIFTLSDDRGPLAVFAFARRQSAGPPMLILGDLFLRDNDDTETPRLLAGWTAKLTRVCGAHGLTLFDCGLTLNRILGAGPLSGTRPFHCSLLVSGEKAEVPDSCYVSAGDGDFIR
jgi:hypothetical protein